MSIDEELTLDEQDTLREMKYIREVLPDDVQAHFADDGLLSWVLEAVATYYYESGILESTSDEVYVDMDEVARYVCSLGEQEGKPALDAREIRLIAEADLDYQEEEA